MLRPLCTFPTEPGAAAGGRVVPGASTCPEKGAFPALARLFVGGCGGAAGASAIRAVAAAHWADFDPGAGNGIVYLCARSLRVLTCVRRRRLLL